MDRERAEREAEAENAAARGRIATDAPLMLREALRPEMIESLERTRESFEKQDRTEDAATLDRVTRGSGSREVSPHVFTGPGLIELAKQLQQGASVGSARDLASHLEAAGMDKADAEELTRHLSSVCIEGTATVIMADRVCASLAEVPIDPRGLSVLAIVASRTPQWVEADTRLTGIVPAPLSHVRAVGKRTPVEEDPALPFGDGAPIGHLATPRATDLMNWLPGVKWSDDGIIQPALPILVLEDDQAAAARAKAPGAPLPLRIYIEAVLAVPLDERDGVRRFALTIRDWRNWLWQAGHEAPSIKRFWPKLERALYLVHNARVPWELHGNGGEWAAVRVVNVPRSAACLGDHVVIDVDLPPGSNRGPQVNRAILRRVGAQSAPQYRALLGLATCWNQYGTHRVTRRGQPAFTARIKPTLPSGKLDAAGHQVLVRNPAANRYPVLRDDDLIRLCYREVAASASGRRSQLARAKAMDGEHGGGHLVALEKLGVVVIERDVRSRNNKLGWRIMPGPAWERPPPGPEGGLGRGRAPRRGSSVPRRPPTP